MLTLKSKQGGFTIVELLIVIIVIAILATISIVAYNGIQNRTNDTVVQQDLNGFAKEIMLYYAREGAYPAGGRAVAADGVTVTGSVTTPPTDITFSVSRAAYSEPASSGAANFAYCTGVVAGTSDKGFSIYARSKSNNRFRYSTMNGMQPSGAGAILDADICAGIDFPRSTSYGYIYGSGGGWQAWTN